MKTFPPANGIPMHLLSELGLHETFLETIERHHRDGLPMILNRAGKTESVPIDQLLPEMTRARNRIAELSAEIAKYAPFSMNEAAGGEGQDYQD